MNENVHKVPLRSVFIGLFRDGRGAAERFVPALGDCDRDDERKKHREQQSIQWSHLLRFAS